MILVLLSSCNLRDTLIVCNLIAVDLRYYTTNLDWFIAGPIISEYCIVFINCSGSSSFVLSPEFFHYFSNNFEIPHAQINHLASHAYAHRARHVFLPSVRRKGARDEP